MLRVKNWSTFQHYKNRKPPWIKLHRSLLDKREWHKLTHASKVLAISLWLLASEHEDPASGLITESLEDLAFRFRMKETEVFESVKELIKLDFIEEVSHETPDLLAPCYQPACPETRDQRQRDKDPPAPSGNPVEKLGDSGDKSYNVRDFFTETDWDKVSVELNLCVHRQWDRKLVFEKYNNFVKDDPPAKPVEGFCRWLQASTWLRRPP